MNNLKIYISGNLPDLDARFSINKEGNSKLSANIFGDLSYHDAAQLARILCEVGLMIDDNCGTVKNEFSVLDTQKNEV